MGDDEPEMLTGREVLGCIAVLAVIGALFLLALCLVGLIIPMLVEVTQ